MDLQAIRTELAALVTGYQTYDSTPGNALTPCVVIGLPDLIDLTEGSYGLAEISLPAIVLHSNAYTLEGETRLLEMLVELAALYRAHPTGTTWRGLTVGSMNRIGNMTVGTAEYLAGAINLTILTNR